MRKHKLTEEEKIAIKIKEMLDKLSIDLEMVGIHFAKISSNLHYNRFQEVFESAEYEKRKPVDFE